MTPAPPFARPDEPVSRFRPGERETVALLALLFLAALVTLAWHTGVTVDEPSHYLSGRLFWEGRDNLHPGDVPPLMKIVSGWVPYVRDAPLPPPAHPGWKTRDEWMLALGLMENMTAAQVHREFFLARLPMLIFPLGCCLLIWWWGRQLFPPWAAVGAATVFCLSPTVLGHSALVKNDMAASFGYLLFWYRAWRFWREPGVCNAAWLGAGVLVGLLAKFSLAILLPIAPAIIFARWLRGRSLERRFELAGWVAACALVVWAGMIAAWQFRLDPVTFSERQAWKADPAIPKFAPKLVHIGSIVPLPGGFWRGGISLLSSNHFTSPYLLGRTVPGGHPLYFLIALAVKAPLSILLLLAIALGLTVQAALRRKLRPGDWCWLLPGFLYLGLASFSGLQLGVRLVLPAIVFLLLASGKAFEAAASRRGLRVAVTVLMVWLAGRTAMAYPNYISYFNSLVGDSWKGLRILSDSNVDWGQDLPHLVEWHRSSGVRRFTVAYFGTENLWAYFRDEEIECVRPPWNAEVAQGRTRLDPQPGWYAISATLLSGQLFPPEYRDYFGAFRGMQPVARAGESIYIFHVR